jgi:hypothetical protein
MPSEETQPYALHFRWGGFSLSLTGRGPMIAWAAVITSLLGLKWLWPMIQTAQLGAVP